MDVVRRRLNRETARASSPRGVTPRAWLGMVLLLMVSSGCALQPRPLPREVTPAASFDRMTVSSEATLVLEKTIDRGPAVDVVSAPGDVPVYSLSDAVAFGLDNNPRLRVAQAMVARAAGQEMVAFAPFLPQVDLYNRYGFSSPTLSPGAPGPVGSITTSTDREYHDYAQAELGLQWTLWDFGRTVGRYRQAVSQQRIAALQYDRARQTIAFEVAAAYIAVMLAQATTIEQQQAVVRAESILKDAKSRREGGVADLDDVLRAEVQLSEMRESLVLAREAEFGAVARLNNAMGRNAALPLRVVDAKIRPAFSRTLVDCLQTAAAERDEVRIAREAVAAAQSGQQAVDADFMPTLSISSGVGNVSGHDVRTGWHGGAGIHLTQKFFAGGRRLGESESAAADVRAAAAKAQTVFDAISLEVNLAYRRVLATRERIPLAETAVKQAAENLRLVRVKYKNGNATPTDVVDAETALTRATQRFNLAAYDDLTALARLQYAMGLSPDAILESPGPRLMFEP